MEELLLLIFFGAAIVLIGCIIYVMWVFLPWAVVFKVMAIAIFMLVISLCVGMAVS